MLFTINLVTLWWLSYPLEKHAQDTLEHSQKSFGVKIPKTFETTIQNMDFLETVKGDSLH